MLRYYFDNSLDIVVSLSSCVRNIVHAKMREFGHGSYFDSSLDTNCSDDMLIVVWTQQCAQILLDEILIVFGHVQETYSFYNNCIRELPALRQAAPPWSSRNAPPASSHLQQSPQAKAIEVRMSRRSRRKVESESDGGAPCAGVLVACPIRAKATSRRYSTTP